MIHTIVAVAEIEREPWADTTQNSGNKAMASIQSVHL